MEKIYAELETKMKKSVEHFHKELGNIRTGRASTAVLDGVRVTYYGNQMPINQVASVAVIEAKTIDIKPWDKGSVSEIEKAIMAANLGLSIVNTGDSLKVKFPDLTEETRKDMVKKVKKMAEESKVDLRNIRRESNEAAKAKEKAKQISEDDLKNAEARIQKVTDKYITDIDNMVKEKEKELMTI
ncbi:MAG: ribosome recycling factor [Spirochaetia bacterium]|nr:ribosome recycling factor [Spirochaetia bacterium]